MVEIKVLSDHCKVCFERREIYFDDGTQGTMREKCWKLLEILVRDKEKDNRISTYNSIKDELWNGVTDYEKDKVQGIKDTVRALRIALSKGSAEPLINTIPTQGYKLINDVRSFKIKPIASVQDLLEMGYTYTSIAEHVMKNDEALYENIPDEYKGSPELWADYMKEFPDFWKFIVDEKGNIQGNFSFIGISDKDGRLLEKGIFDDNSLSDSRMINLYKAGTYVGYLANLSVNPAFETYENYEGLWTELCKVLVNSAEQSNVYFKKIYYKAFPKIPDSKVTGHGFRFLRKDSKYGNVFVHDMDEYSIESICTADSYGKTLGKLYESQFESNIPELPQEGPANAELHVASQAYFTLWGKMNDLFQQQNYFQYRPYFFEDAELKEKESLFYYRGIVIGWWIRNLLQYMEALLPYIPKAQRKTHQHYKEMFNDSFFVLESKDYYEFTTESHSEKPNYEYIPSVKSLISFTNIWLDFDELFMRDELLPFLDIFYKPHAGLPENKNDLKICEALAIRMMTALKCAEEHLGNIPTNYVYSYADYKEMLRTTSIMWYVSTKYPFLQEELGWSFNDRPVKTWQQIEKEYY